MRESPLRKILKFVVGDGASTVQNKQVFAHFTSTGRGGACSSRNKRIPQNNQPACHSERSAEHEVELPRVERSEQAEARRESAAGIS